MTPEPNPTRAFFGRRKGHKLRPNQTRLVETVLPQLALDLSHPAPPALDDLFPVAVNDVELEIGFGGGEFLIGRAQRQPHTGFIGVEPYINGMAKALAGIESNGLRNIRLHSDDAASLIAWLPDAALARIDLIHPDPWPKRRHWKRRFVQEALIAQLGRILRHGGEFRFVTDIADYTSWTLQRFIRSGLFEWTAERADDWRKPWPEFGGTRYNSKAVREDRASCFLLFRRV
ncbi:MAG: tRNA (guanine(46)-N(7))-methyltransferase TrmB [Xanthobacteraceae bacterium]